MRCMAGGSLLRNILCDIFAGMAMSNLSSTLDALDRPEEAIEMREKTLEFYCRVLPDDHPDIGEGDALYRACIAFHV
jgi:hypothetical protein